jgi:uncharacterized protein YjbJ (UPF0337 family)
MADWDQVEGTAKEKAGQLTDDERLEAEGKTQGAWGDAKDTAGDAKDTVEDKADDLFDKARDKAS